MTARQKILIFNKVSKILRSTLDWDKTAYHGDIVITNIDKAADKIIKYFKPKLRGKKNA